MVLAPEYRHMPLRTLSLYAQRLGRVFASASTWARRIRKRGWRRPRLRVHPAMPAVGVRATAPNELWHIDVSILRLLDGTKAYIHAVIDNFSRKVVAWTIGARLDPTATCRVLVDAGRHLVTAGTRPTITVMADSGVENVNAAVDATLLAERLHRVLAQVEVNYSNSMIEAQVAIPEASVALPQLPRHHRVRSNPGRVLRGRAQHQDAPRRVPRPDA
jgi:putative transposase